MNLFYISAKRANLIAFSSQMRSAIVAVSARHFAKFYVFINHNSIPPAPVHSGLLIRNRRIRVVSAGWLAGAGGKCFIGW